MKTTMKLLVVLALAMATFMQHSTASAADIIKFRGDGAQAFFSSTDGCIVTDVSVSATDGIFQNPPGKGSPVFDVFLFISQYDFCTDTQLLRASGYTQLADAEFQVSPQLDSATLNTTVNVFDFESNTSFDVFVNLAWTGISPLSRDSSKFHFKSPGCNYHLRIRGDFRFAEASGSVSDGTTNFTPDPSVDARIYSSKSGEVVIGCN
jgi:hypothetical protein